MHARIAHRYAWRRVSVLLTATLVLWYSARPAWADVKLDQLRVGPDVYRNVTVTGSNGTDVFLMHSRGLANLKIKNLDPETRWRLGLGPKPGSPEALAESEAAARAREGSVGLFARWFGSVRNDPAPGSAATPPSRSAKASSWSASFQVNPMQPVGEWLAATAKSGPGLLIILGALLLTYWFACYCLKRIVRKAGYEPNFGIWIPILNYLHALRAAGMSDAWLAVPFFMIVAGKVAFVGAAVNKSAAALWLMAYVILLGFAAVLAFIGQVLWCVRIVGARGKGYWLSIFLILAVLCPLAAPLAMISEQLFTICWFAANALGLFAFLYLAFSSAEEDSKDAGNHMRIIIPSVLTEA